MELSITNGMIEKKEKKIHSSCNKQICVSVNVQRQSMSERKSESKKGKKNQHKNKQHKTKATQNKYVSINK